MFPNVFFCSSCSRTTPTSAWHTCSRTVISTTVFSDWPGSDLLAVLMEVWRWFVDLYCGVRWGKGAVISSMEYLVLAQTFVYDIEGDAVL